MKEYTVRETFPTFHARAGPTSNPIIPNSMCTLSASCMSFVTFEGAVLPEQNVCSLYRLHKSRSHEIDTCHTNSTLETLKRILQCCYDFLWVARKMWSGSPI